MNIYGYGIDLIDINRLGRKLEKSPNLLKRIYNKNEIKQCKKKITKYNCFAKKFAAKEAFSKALGTGFTKGLSLKDIEINKNISGKPKIILHGKSIKIVKNRLKKRYKILLSISDEKKIAFASVLIIL